MKKILYFILCLILCFSLLTACTGTDNGKENAEKPTEATAEKATASPAATAAQTEATPVPSSDPEPTAVATPTAEPEPTAIPTVDSFTADDFAGNWYLVSYVVDGAESNALEEGNATIMTISDDMKISYDSFLWGEHRINEVQCAFTPSDAENASYVYGEFSDEGGYPSSYTCYILEDGSLEFNHYFTYDMGTIPVNSQQIFTRDNSIYNQILDNFALDASFMGYGVDNIGKYIFDGEDGANSIYGKVSAPYLVIDDDWEETKDSAEYLNGEFGKTAKENCTRLEKIIGNLTPDDKAAIIDLNGSDELYLNTYLDVIRNDTAVLSGLLVTEGYLGGVHPDYTIQTVNYDRNTGKYVKLGDFCKDPDKLYEILVNELSVKYPDVTFLDMEGTLKTMFSEDTLPFVIGYGGIDFYFSPISLATYADGMLTASVSFADYEGLFNARYANIPYAYTIKAATGIPYYLDIDADGKREEILIDVLLGGWNDYADMLVYINNINVLDFKLKELTYEFTPYIMQSDKGSFLYADTTYDSDDNVMFSFKFKDGSLTNTGSWSNSFYSFSDTVPAWTGEDEWVDFTEINDPYSLKLFERNDLLGTKSIIVPCYVNEEGKNKTTSNVFKFNYYQLSEITALQAIKAFKSDMFGKKGDECKIAKGTRLYAYAYAGGNSVILSTTDEKEFYLVEFDNEVGTLGGKANYELFDGLFFAD